MAKLVPLLCAGTGAAVVSVGGVYLLKNNLFQDIEDGQNRGQNREEEKEQPKAEEGEPLFTGLQDFKGKKGGSFTKEFFTEDVDFSSLGDSTSSGEIESTYFASTATSDSDKGTSRVSFSWERTDSTLTDAAKKKWKGTFRWLWNFKRGQKGFSMFVTTKLSDKNNALDLEGGLYLLEKSESSGNKWTIKKSKEFPATSSVKSLTSASFDMAMPKATTDIANALKDVDSEMKSYWGFVKDKSDLTKVCKKSETECPESPDSKGKSFRGSLSWTPATEENSGKKLSYWSINFEQWAPIFFNNGTSKFRESIDSIRGEWKVD